MINEKQIDYFMTVAHEKNMSKAARRLYISQPALSRYISQLEKELGTLLFRREPHGLTLTPAGELYLESCQKVNAIYRSVLNQMAYSDDLEKKQIRIGVTTLTGEFLIPHLIHYFDQNFLHVELHFIEERMEALYDMVTENKVDLALVYHTHHTTLQYTKIMENRVYLQVPPSFVKEREVLDENWYPGTQNPAIPIKLLQDQTMILLKEGRGMRKIADSLFTLYHIEPRHIMETTSIHFCGQLTDLDKGFTFVPGMALHRYKQEAPQSFYCQLEEQAINRPIYCCYKEYDYLTPAEKSLITFMSQIEERIRE